MTLKLTSVGQTKGRGVDHIVEVGGTGTLKKSVNSIRYAGSIHLIGFVAGVRPSFAGSARTVLTCIFLR